MEGDGDLKSLIGSDRAQSNRNIPPIWNEVSHSSFILCTVPEKLEHGVDLLNESHRTNWMQIMRFLTNPHKPMILALSRPDPKKNVTTLLKAFGECQALRELANLVIISFLSFSSHCLYAGLESSIRTNVC